eukprot:CAMPEP_0117752354 /NCGR_PEP_ID=MMETSP0947-20121206/11557_1 /TAXON_ID=44440 /ORGANISM="Chattonella subsalsa, Strain CCMP2191" /LENGTH=312 /DNA_ID=CAMNT_0005570983 /DNA_START=270 /DNA_END=1208 /DNA_ORIENTATION=-
MTAMELHHLKRVEKKITMVTAYDYPSAKHVDLAGIDVLLVGDSVAMVELGYDTTQPVTMDQMLHHCQAVARGASHPLLVGDMPFGSYEISADQALTNAYRFIKEGKMDAVKMEGGKIRAETVRKVVEGGIAVMGHVGLTPQAISVIGGFRAQGRTAIKARKLVDDALALQDAGAFAVVIECVPEIVGKVITESLEIPTIGIGAGKYTSGQVLVYHDMLGMMSHPHHAAFVPKFCKRYADVGGIIKQGLEAFKDDVESSAFPNDNFNPYKMSAEEEQKLVELMKIDTSERQKKKEKTAKALSEADEYETIKVY